jgi:hypothetical protein
MSSRRAFQHLAAILKASPSPATFIRTNAKRPNETKPGDSIMGYNRAGKRRTDRMKRHKKHIERLVAKLVAEMEASKGAAPAKAAEAPK